MESRQKLVLPASRYPITVISLRVSQGTEVRKDEVLGIYEYLASINVKKTVMVHGREVQQDIKTEQKVKEEWRSQYAGKVDRINVRPGQVVTDPRSVSRNKPRL